MLTCKPELSTYDVLIFSLVLKNNWDNITYIHGTERGMTSLLFLRKKDTLLTQKTIPILSIYNYINFLKQIKMFQERCTILLFSIRSVTFLTTALNHRNYYIYKYEICKCFGLKYLCFAKFAVNDHDSFVRRILQKKIVQ